MVFVLMDRKKLILAILFVGLFIVILYQATHLKNYGIKKSMIKEITALRKSSKPELKLKEIQLSHVNLNKLKDMAALPHSIGRNLFKFVQEEDWQANVYKEDIYEEEQISPTAFKELEIEERGIAQFFGEINARFIGFAEVNGKRIAGVIIDDDIHLGLEGDVIANKFVILKITDNFLEIGIPNTKQKQRLFIEGE